MIRCIAGLVLLASFGGLLAGCGSGGEVSNADEAAKMSTLHKAEQESRAKDGVKSD